MDVRACLALRGSRMATVALLAATTLVVACGGAPPAPDRLAAEVGRLDAVLSIVEELRATDFEDSAQCRNLGYARGAFGDLAQDGCERAGTEQFDAVALADHARLAEAIEASGVSTDRMLVATYDADGELETARFHLEGAPFLDYWEYLYDPGAVEVKLDVPDQRDYTRINDDWWFVLSPDD